MKGVADSTTLEEEEKRGRKMIPSQQLQQLQLQSEKKLECTLAVIVHTCIADNAIGCVLLRWLGIYIDTYNWIETETRERERETDRD